ncbi:MAG: nitrile hydratase subunit alpha [Defluviicoccus sp.]|nr:nitrile hydratase subunit alpha [Defluviicoccus sp.]MDE0384896.1 nitrile hydratase subunit alpha [Defluviicoccus sp.]
MSRHSPIVGRLVARAWSDPVFADRLVADATAMLGSLGIALPAGKTVAAVQNTDTVTHLVLPSPRYAETASPYAEIKAFGETYGDPRYAPLDWISRDPVFMARFEAAPAPMLRSWGIVVADGITISTVRNTPARVWLVLPVPPGAGDLTDELLDEIAAGWLPPALRYVSIEGKVRLDRFARR